MYAPIVSFAVAFIVAAAFGPALIRLLRRLKFGQKILEDGPTWHLEKQNIPTMGGILFIMAISVAMLVCLILFGGADSGRWIFVLCMALAFGAIGSIDDFCKIKNRRNKGLSAKAKFLLQLAVSILFISIMRVCGLVEPVLEIPFFEATLRLPWIVYFIFAGFVIVGTDNAVNLTDGLDGLCSCVTFIVMAFFCFACLRLSQTADEGFLKLALLPAAAAGGLGGFLIYNFYPAKVFMGDTGSLFLGGLVAGMAFALEMPLILILVGIIYIIEVLSDILQVGYFKLSHGKRLFKMAPIHHHFEMCGFSERQIVFAASAITLLMCAVSTLAIR